MAVRATCPAAEDAADLSPTDGDLIAVAERLQAACLERGLTLSLAESCTGGLVAATVTEIAGSSAYFLGGVVSYANSAKVALLDVPTATLESHGAVSAQVAKAMADGARARFGSDLAASITGIAGPDGGSSEKPVGLVYLGLASGERSTEVRRLQLDGDRGAVRRAAARAALVWLVGAAEGGAAVRATEGAEDETRRAAAESREATP